MLLQSQVGPVAWTGAIVERCRRLGAERTQHVPGLGRHDLVGAASIELNGKLGEPQRRLAKLVALFERRALADQELDARASTGNIYWEGAVLAVGEEGARGRGYVELTGYVPTATALSLDILTGPRADLCSGLP